jgi:hypothetical protein
MKKVVQKTDWIDSHLYLSHKFNAELKFHGIEKVADVEKLLFSVLLNFKTITIPKLRRFADFMEKNNLRFASTAE